MMMLMKVIIHCTGDGHEEEMMMMLIMMMIMIIMMEKVEKLCSHVYNPGQNCFHLCNKITVCSHCVVAPLPPPPSPV